MPATRIERFRAARRDPALAVLEGFHAVKHALRFGADLLEVVCTDPQATAALAQRHAPGIADELIARQRRIHPDEFAVLSPARVPTEMMAIARRAAVDAEAVLADPASGRIVLLENPTSPFNVGAALRVAAAAGAAGLFTTGRVDPWNATALRAGAGLAWALPVALLQALPDTDRPIVALHPEGVPLTSVALPERAVLAFGTERDGLSEALLARADFRLTIPMRAGVSSLNLATAVAVALYRPTD